MKRVLTVVFLSVVTVKAEADIVDYVSDVLPIMKSRCWECHSNENSVKGSLALDDLDEVRDYQIGKYNIIRPGNPAESGFLERLTLDSNHTDFMPRKGDPLPKDEVATIEKWIEHGAVIDASKPTEDEAQRLEAVKVSSGGSDPGRLKAGFHQWTNKAGKVIEARMLSLNGETVKLALRNGVGYDVSLDDLSPESVTLARRLGGAE